MRKAAGGKRPGRQAIPLLGPDDPPPFEYVAGDGISPFLLTCDHAGKRIPRALGTLGLGPTDLERHIAWDIGAAGVARRVAAKLNATLILQTYSRLVIDCNRPPEVPSSIATLSEATEIPGNVNIGPDDAAARRREIFQPYHDRIRAELDARQATGRKTILCAMHSFTPEYKGVKRPWHAAALYNRGPGYALAVRDLLKAEPGLAIGDNEPYFVSDATDYTVPVHAERRFLPYIELEMRQDLIADETGQEEWATRMARIFTKAAEKLSF